MFKIRLKNKHNLSFGSARFIEEMNLTVVTVDKLTKAMQKQLLAISDFTFATKQTGTTESVVLSA